MRRSISSWSPAFTSVCSDAIGRSITATPLQPFAAQPSATRTDTTCDQGRKRRQTVQDSTRSAVVGRTSGARSSLLRGWAARARFLRAFRSDLPIELEVSGFVAGDQLRAAVGGQILQGPLDEHHQAALELNDVHQVDEHPDDPGWQSGEVKPEDVGDGGRPADHGKASL